MERCRVCRDPEVREFAFLRGRRYLRCPLCDATMVDASQLPGRDAERTHYLNHENDPGDPGYRRFVSKLIDPLAARLPAGALGLDYGCGPGPVGAAMLREQGFTVNLYDPYFAPDEAALNGTYDFIICSEVVEHFHRPADEFDRLAALLKPGGWLGIMTCFQTDDDRFADWHYPRDPTHVVFYREETFRRLAARHGWSCDVPAKDIVLMQAPAGLEADRRPETERFPSI